MNNILTTHLMGLSGIQIMDDWDEFPAACMTTSATVDAAPMVTLNHMFYGLVGELSESQSL